MSRLPFELLLALRYLRPKRTFVSIITLISVLGVTLGVAVLIIVISVMTGFDQKLRDKILGFNAHMKIYQVDPITGTNMLTADQPRVLMTDYQRVTKIVAANPNVLGVTPFALDQVMLMTEKDPARPMVAAPYLRATDPEADTNVTRIASKIISGSGDLSGHSVLVGRELARNYNLRPGDPVALMTGPELEQALQHRKDTNSEITLPRDYEVRGIFDCGFYEYNSQVMVTSLETFQELYKISNAAPALIVLLKDPNQSVQVREQLAAALGRNFSITIWQEESNETMAAVLVEKNVMLYILFFIVIVAAFGITCTLITFVVLKTREIGVLKALGATSRQVAWVFLSQSIVVSILGVSVGLVTGILGVVYRNPFLHGMRKVTGLDLFPAGIYEFYDLPALIIPGDIAIICGGSMIICLLAAAFPVWNASRLKPVEALRHE